MVILGMVYFWVSHIITIALCNQRRPWRKCWGNKTTYVPLKLAPGSESKHIDGFPSGNYGNVKSSIYTQSFID